MFGRKYFSEPWWPVKILSHHAEISLYLLTHLLLSTSAQMALYELDINQDAGKGIFVTYHQVLMVKHYFPPLTFV